MDKNQFIKYWIGRSSGSAGPNGSPSNLAITIVDNTEITLTWDYSCNNEDGFQILHAGSDDGITYDDYTEAGIVYGVHTFSDTGLTKNYYRYVVRAFIDDTVVRTIPSIVSSAIDVANQVKITFDRDIKPISIPAVSAFALAGKTISGVSISGAIVTLTITGSYEEGDIVTVSYTKPSTNPIKALTGNMDADSFTGYPVTNNLSSVLPVFVSVAVANATPTKVILTYDIALDETSVPATGDFTVTDHTISSVAVSGSTVELTLSTAFIFFDWLCYVTYTKGANRIRAALTFSEADNLASTLITNNVLDDGYSVARFDPTATGGRVHSLGVESIYWDLMTGSAGRGAEENSGTTVAYGVYEITATEVNHFFAGCAIGNVFPSNGAIALDANNKVKRVTGNHATQPLTTNQPTNQVFDGVDNFMRTATFTLAKPTYIYLVAKPISYASNDRIIDGYTAHTMALIMVTADPKVRLYNWSSGSYVSYIMNQTQIFRIRYIAGANASTLQVDSGVAGIGTTAGGSAAGVTIAATGAGANFGNIQFYEMIVRNNAGAANYDTSLYNALKRKWGTS